MILPVFAPLAKIIIIVAVTIKLFISTKRKEELRNEGVNFTSETDSEVIVHLIAKHYRKLQEAEKSKDQDQKENIKEAVIKTIKELQGAYAFCVIKNDTREIIGARNGSPLIIGVGKNENFLASDV